MNHDIKEFVDELNKTIQNRKFRQIKLIVSGDYNINLLKKIKKNVCKLFSYTNSLFPYINYPTRLTRTTAILIDNIFSNTVGYNVKSGIISNTK